MKSLPHARPPRVSRLRSGIHATEGMSSGSLFEKGFLKPSLSHLPSFASGKKKKKELGNQVTYGEGNIYDTHESKIFSELNGRSLGLPET